MPPNLLRWLKWGATVLVVAALVWAARSGIRQLVDQPPDWSRVDWRKLGLACVAIAGAQGLTGFFWVSLLPLPMPPAIADSSQQRQRLRAFRAFFWSQLGKYVPGKAMVILIRTGMTASLGVAMPAAIASVFVETLLFVAVGALVGLLAMAWAGIGSHWMSAMAIACALFVGVVSTPPAFGWMESRILKRLGRTITRGALNYNWSSWALGLLTLSLAWFLLGWGLLLTVQGIGPEPCEASQYPVCLSAVCLATVAGFVAMVPGGLGVRELVILPLLATVATPGQALASAIVFRLGTICVELVISGTLWGWELAFLRTNGEKAEP